MSEAGQDIALAMGSLYKLPRLNAGMGKLQSYLPLHQTISAFGEPDLTHAAAS